MQAFALAGTTVIAAGDQGLLRSSNDGGVTWSGVDKAAIGAVNLSGVSCASALLCVMTTAAGNGQPGNDLIRYEAPAGTSSGTPSTSQVTPSGTPIAAAAFAAGSNVVAAGNAGVTALSADAGKTFTPVGSKLPGSFNGVVAGPGEDRVRLRRQRRDRQDRQRRRGLDAGQRPDLGDAQRRLVPDARRRLRARRQRRPVRHRGRAAPPGARSTSARRRRRGRCSRRRATTVFVAGPRSVRRSVDGGTSFTAATGKIAKKSVNQLDGAGGSTIFAWGGDSLWRTTDKGKTWTSVKFPTRIVKLRNGKKVNAFFIDQVDFVNAKTGYLEGDGGRLFRTANTGKSWTELFSAGTTRLADLAFGSASKGYLVSREGSGPSTILRTSDSGATWAPQVVVSDPIGAGGIATGPDATDYLLAGTTDLLFTTTGGGTGLAVDADDQDAEDEAEEGGDDHRDRQAVTGAGRARRDRVVPAGRVAHLAADRRQDRLDRLVHDVVEGPQGHEPVRRPVARRRAARRRRQRAC